MVNNNTRKAAIYTRVSTSDQDTRNQLHVLETFASQQNYKVVCVYRDIASGGDCNRPQFKQMLMDARMHMFSTLFIWSLDRFSREGISQTLSYIKRLKNSGVSIKSYTEGWLDTSEGGMGDLLIAIMSWMAKQERQRISERTKAGLARTDKQVGRPPGSRDKKKRRTFGYHKRWQ